MVNRVLFVSDCFGAPESLPDAAAEMGRNGMSVTAVGVGTQADMNIINLLGKRSGGSSRFLSNVEKIEETFGPDLDRMLVPTAVDLAMELQFEEGTEVTGTWGYNGVIDGSRVSYTHHTLHNQDYETIMVRFHLPPAARPGIRRIGTFTITYHDVAGDAIGPHRYELRAHYDSIQPGLIGISEPSVLQAHTALRAALSLEEIGTLHQSLDTDRARTYGLQGQNWNTRNTEAQALRKTSIDQEIVEINNTVRMKQQRCIDLSLDMRKEIRYVRTILGTDVLESEKKIFDSYAQMFAREIQLSNDATAGLMANPSLRPMGSESMLPERLRAFTGELTAPLDGKRKPKVMFFEFGESGGMHTELGVYVNSRINDELKDVQLLSPEDGHLDIIAAAHAAGAEYAVSGSIIHMNDSIAIVGKLLRMPEAETETVVYSILPRDDDVEEMTAGSGQ